MGARKARQGHEAHTQASDRQESLAGRFARPVKLTFIGAGSGFCPRLISDLLQIAGLQGGTLGLVDTDAGRLRIVQKLIARRVSQTRHAGKWNIVASTDRKRVLKGSDYVINSIEVNGLSCVDADYDIPARYGVKQCIGDTIGPGGLFKGLRTIPVFLDILRDAERLCPEALVLNYTNPMSMLCLAAGRASAMRVVGLCHSVQGTVKLLAERLGVQPAELDWACSGINHLAWFTRLRHRGRDQYPRLRRQARAEVYGNPAASDNAREGDREIDLVRKDMLLHFGAFITESSGHLSEYVPYYRKREDLLQRYARAGYEGESRFYANLWPEWRAKRNREQAAALKGKRETPPARSWEYASWIIEAIEKNAPWAVHGNVMNTASDGSGPLIPNLLHDGCVEVPCLVDGNGITPVRSGALPPQMAALCRANQSVFDLAVQAALERSKERAVQALLLDPLTAAVCSPAEIRRLTLELFRAEQEFLPGYR